MPESVLYGYWERLVPITVEGHRFEVPEGIPLLRALQYVELELKGLDTQWHQFCWNNMKGCCISLVRKAPGEEPIETRICRLSTREGMEVVRLPKWCKLAGVPGEPAAGAASGDDGEETPGADAS